MEDKYYLRSASSGWSQTSMERLVSPEENRLLIGLGTWTTEFIVE